MHGAVFGAMVVAIAVILIAGLTPILIVPIVAIALAALFVLPLLTAARDTHVGAGEGPSGVPSTSDASYDPQQRPQAP